MSDISIGMDIETAATLHALIDGCIGSSDDDDFVENIYPVRTKLEKAIMEYYSKRKTK